MIHEKIETLVAEVETPTTIKNDLVACTLAELLFDVSIQDNPRATNSEYSKVVTGVVDGDEMDLNYCSPRYELVDNKEIFPEIEEILKAENVEYSVKYQHINHVRFYADYQITDKRFTHTMNGTNDSIEPLIRVRHSYNGQTKYAIIFGYFRLICSNGLVIPVEEMNEFNLAITGKHTASIIGSINELKSTLHNFTTNAGNVVTRIINKYQFLADSVVTNARKRVEAVLKGNKITAIDNNKFNTVNDILKRIEKEANMFYNGQTNNWLVYNGINAYINDNDLNIVAPEIRKEKDSKVFEYMLADVM